ncbi:hypothetical protein VitviT2T_009550 [Vitis vinifera]|uniref:MYND-type domain-containing protein n=2 Tax=Vitis vinifera TaxID=29760 RepID=A0ABY9C5Y7_VITVI|nr:uncharacterized protein LOC100241925 [Vitis vinifera]WJZ90404.1 hypothetical protein VitviT2T_009550 [Vitis vinifera]|eukprot:XP_002269082.2 PREDICTED: programmed cell death protein 2 [Vitis vinifera]
MPDEAEMDLDGHSVEEQLKAFQISSLKDEDLDEEEGEAADSNSDVVDDDDCEAEPVTLGFVEKPKNGWSLLCHMFPSKAGGLPAWLDPINLPSGKSSLCDICQTPLQFLLQVYAPISEKESTFHRSLFVFMCTSMECILQDKREQWKCPPEKASRSVKVFRCQLPRSNPFYSSEPPRGDGTDKPSGIGARLCNWCGTWNGDKVCSSCRKAHYCSEKHQVMHWRSGHKFVCRQMKTSSESSNSIPVNNRTTSNKLEKVASNTLWSEYEIINEDECEFDIEMSEDNGYSSSLVSNDRSDETFKALLKHFEADDDKKSWTSFQECIGKAPEQVLRYCRSPRAKPVWPISSGRPSQVDAPKCRYCGGPSVFEFQILPQLLYYFGVKDDVDCLDWSTIAVYTCEASCEASLSYKEEFAWIQV